jgi:DNA-binding IscR family transcriptional regulator
VDDPSFCERSPSCISREIWEEASKNMRQTLEETTLATMVAKQKEKRQNEAGS